MVRINIYSSLDGYILSDFYSIRASARVCAASSCLCPKCSSNLLEVNRFCPELIHHYSLIL
ncbi:hypothetical protein DPMN_172398 [Dreissena polymorpha]|uniref:Uncharacterized protein n=1 Tax=Dreissena polymorpha TaxID=45954 RepID=A0A9D4IDA5_DREPO|nr:hypothetical protein DPMN_172398 [Dreissena polymorpha]